MGFPGLSFKAVYTNGDHIRTAGADGKEWSRDTTLSYTVQSGPAKGLSTAIRQGIFRTDMQRDSDEYRVIIDYPISLF
jgi:hypothetical protein